MADPAKGAFLGCWFAAPPRAGLAPAIHGDPREEADVDERPRDAPPRVVDDDAVAAPDDHEGGVGRKEDRRGKPATVQTRTRRRLGVARGHGVMVVVGRSGDSAPRSEGTTVGVTVTLRVRGSEWASDLESNAESYGSNHRQPGGNAAGRKVLSGHRPGRCGTVPTCGAEGVVCWFRTCARHESGHVQGAGAVSVGGCRSGVG